MAGLMATPSKVDKEVPFQPVIYARDGTPRRALSQSDYEQRKQLCTSQFLQKVNAEMRVGNPKGASSSEASGGGISPKQALIAAVSVIVPILAFFASKGIGRSPVVDIPGASWATIFPAEQQADWSFGCHLTNITKDKEAGLVSFTAHFADLPADAFTKGALQAPFAEVFRLQVSELGDYAFNTSEVSIEFSGKEPSLDTNVTLATQQELIVFMGKITSGALAGRLAANRAFRRVLTDAGYTPKMKNTPIAIKNSWLEPMVESATKTQEEASFGMLGYMHKVQQSYDEFRRMLVTSEDRQANLTEQLQAKTAALNQLQHQAAQMKKDIDAKDSVLDERAKAVDKLSKSEAEAKDKLAQVQKELDALRKDNASKGKELEHTKQRYQGLQVQHKEVVDRLQMYQGDKSQLAEKYDQLAKDKDQKDKQLSTVAGKLHKVLVDHFNITADKAAKPEVLVAMLDRQVKNLKTDTKAALDKLQSEADDAKAQLDKEKATGLAELKKAEDKFAATLAQKEKDAAATLAVAEAGTARAVESATKQLQADLKGRDRKLADAEKHSAAVQSKLDTAQQQLSDKQAKIEDQQKKVKSLSDDLAQLEKELKSTTKSRDSLQTQADSLKSELSNASAKFQEVAGTIQTQDKHIKKLERMVYKLLSVRITVDEVNKDFEEYKSKTPAIEPVAAPAPAAAAAEATAA